MSPLRRFDHVGITVADLATVTAFFVGLGFETEGRTVLEGEFVETISRPLARPMFCAVLRSPASSPTAAGGR